MLFIFPLSDVRNGNTEICCKKLCACGRQELFTAQLITNSAAKRVKSFWKRERGLGGRGEDLFLKEKVFPSPQKIPPPYKEWSDHLNILFIGDVVGQRSAGYLVKTLPALKRSCQVDLTIVNGENSADGNGITPYSAKILLDFADVITTGNHCFRRKEMNDMFEESSVIIRPANYGDTVGRGYTVLDMGRTRVAVVNLIGMAYMESCDNPFHCVDRLLKEIDTPNIIVDFHAEATSEKKAMGWYLAKRVSAVVGTHTHVQTADEQILGEWTGYITDVGFTGVRDSVLGVDKDVIIAKLTTYYPQKHIYPEGDIMLNAVLITIDEKSGRCTAIERINQ